MNVLGFACYGHDAAAALAVDDEVVFAVEEERLVRRKHHGGFPERAIAACLSHAGLALSDLDHVGFFWRPGLSWAHVPVYLARYPHRVPGMLAEQRTLAAEEQLGMLGHLGAMRRLPRLLRERFAAGGRARFRFHHLEHHLCHAASAFYPSGFEEAAVLTLDGAGEWTTATLAHGRGTEIRRLLRVQTPHSLGAFYQAIGRHLGFALIEGPGKLMGLSSYGRRNGEVYRRLRQLVTLLPDGGFRLDMRYFAYHYSRRSGVTPRFVAAFGPPRSPGGDAATDWSEPQLELAAAAQQVVEDVVVHMASSAQRRTGSRRLCLAGGVALNGVANGLLARSGAFDELFVQPAAGDSGTSVGAALAVSHSVLGRPRRWTMRDAFLGPECDEAACAAALAGSGLPHARLGDGVVAGAAAALAAGRIVAWFQGRLELGPRALGHRSILASPLLPEIKETLNARVKHRERFRPFAAVVREEEREVWFDAPLPNPYMLVVYAVRPEHRRRLPAITHADGSVRLQTVGATEQPRLRALLAAFGSLTGVPVLLNTSFNLRGEPIVASPADAVDSFCRGDLDLLVLGEHVAVKAGGGGWLDRLVDEGRSATAEGAERPR